MRHAIRNIGLHRRIRHDAKLAVSHPDEEIDHEEDVERQVDLLRQTLSPIDVLPSRKETTTLPSV